MILNHVCTVISRDLEDLLEERYKSESIRVNYIQYRDKKVHQVHLEQGVLQEPLGQKDLLDLKVIEE